MNQAILYLNNTFRAQHDQKKYILSICDEQYTENSVLSICDTFLLLSLDV
jgi:hypothetical protein